MEENRRGMKYPFNEVLSGYFIPRRSENSWGELQKKTTRRRNMENTAQPTQSAQSAQSAQPTTTPAPRDPLAGATYGSDQEPWGGKIPPGAENFL